VSRRLPIFALPGVVLLPETLLPLHIFETRYRAMVRDALEGDRLIGMALLRPGWEQGGADPEIFPMGGAGEVVESEALEDGRYNILLRGAFRYRIVEELGVDPYRQARVATVPSLPFSDGDAERLARSAAIRLFDAVRREMELPPLPAEDLSPERLASEIALRLRYAPPELQALLETDSLPNRFESLAGRLREWQRRIRFLAPHRPGSLDPGRN